MIKIIKTEFKFKVGEDNIIGFFYFNNFIFVFCRDGNLYLVNFEKIIENYENYLMSIEDAESLKMMETLAKSKKSKKSKKDKGKKTKKKKKLIQQRRSRDIFYNDVIKAES